MTKPKYLKFLLEDKTYRLLPEEREGMEVQEVTLWPDKARVAFKNGVTVQCLRGKESPGLKDLGIE